MNGVLGILLYLLEVPAVLWLCYRCLDGEERVWKNGRYLLLFFQLLRAGVGICSFFRGWNGGLYGLMSVLSLAVFLVITVLWSRSGGRVFIKGMLFVSGFELLYQGSVWLLRMLYGRERYLDLTPAESLTALLVLLLFGIVGFLGAALVLYKKWYEKLPKTAANGAAGVLLSALLVAVLVLFSEMEGEVLSVFAPLFLGLVLAAFFAALLYLQKRSLGNERYLRTQRQRILEDYYAVLDGQNSLIQRVCHDMDRQISRVQFLARQGRTEEMVLEASRLKEEYEGLKHTSHTGSRLVDELLRRKEQVCREKRIRLEMDFKQFDGGYVSNQEWLSLFFCLFDAAIDSCVRLDKGRERFIKIRTKCAGGFEVLNFSFSHKKAGLFGKGNLFGERSGEDAQKLYIAEKIAKKYGGTVTKMEEPFALRICVSIQVREKRQEKVL